jgi:hypothetical protein
MAKFLPYHLTRRQALEVLGIGAAAAAVRFAAATAAARAANGLPPAPGRGGAGRGGGPDIMHDVDLMSAEVANTKSAGVACIVDGGHADMGRNIDFLRQVSMKSGVPIVAGGGFYSQPFYPKGSPP